MSSQPSGRVLALGALFAGLAVVLGAFGAHALETRLDSRSLEIWDTAVRWQMAHALALVLVAWSGEQRRMFSLIAGLFAGGILAFSGTLYALALGAPRWFGAITPVGGSAWIAAWCLLAYAGLKGHKGSAGPL